MTHQEFDKRLDEIFYQYRDEYNAWQANPRGSGTNGIKLQNKAKQAIDRLFLDAVGADLPIGDEIAEGRSYTGERLHNRVKADIRTTITGKEGGDE